MSRRRVRIFRRGTRAPPYGAGALSTRRGRRLDVPSARRRRAVIARSTPRVLASRREAPRQSVPLPQISAKITTIPHKILCTYPKYGNFAGNGCAGDGGVLYSDRQSHTRAAPRKGRRVVFLGVCTCRAGPMCPAAGYAFFGGARGPRPTGQVRYPPVGDGVPTSRQRGSTALGDGFPRQCSHWLGMTGNGRTESSAPTNSE